MNQVRFDALTIRQAPARTLAKSIHATDRTMAQLSSDNMGWPGANKADAPPPKRYRIGELARHTGLTRQTLHNYTHWGLIEEAEWTPGGHRLYDESVFARLGKILRLRKAHTVEQMKSLLDQSPATTGANTGHVAGDGLHQAGGD